jgi:sigma-B regulation protein RsbU (phosphoserine phosphatase)
VETVLVAEEISTNIEKYGELPAGSEVLLDLSISASTLAMEFSDRGVAFDPLRDGKRSELGADIESAEIGGLGVHLITQLTDEQSYRHEGGRNILRVVKLLDTDSA